MVSAVCQFFGRIGARCSCKLRADAGYFAPSTLMAPTSRFLDRHRCGDSIQLRCQPISSLSYLTHSRGCTAEVSCRPHQLIQFHSGPAHRKRAWTRRRAPEEAPPRRRAATQSTRSRHYISWTPPRLVAGHNDAPRLSELRHGMMVSSLTCSPQNRSFCNTGHHSSGQANPEPGLVLESGRQEC